MLPKLAAAGWPAPASVVAPLTWKPLPAVEKTAPRGEVVLKKLAGRLLGAEAPAATASQLISRRTPPNEPAAPALVPPPRSVRKSSRAASRAGSVGPVPAPERTVWAPQGKVAARASALAAVTDSG